MHPWVHGSVLSRVRIHAKIRRQRHQKGTNMTGITDVIRNCRRAYWQGRLALLLLVARLPPSVQSVVRTLVLPAGSDDIFDDPVGRMPQAKLEFFQELRQRNAPPAVRVAPVTSMAGGGRVKLVIQRPKQTAAHTSGHQAGRIIV